MVRNEIRCERGKYNETVHTSEEAGEKAAEHTAYEGHRVAINRTEDYTDGYKVECEDCGWDWKGLSGHVKMIAAKAFVHVEEEDHDVTITSWKP